MRKPRPSGARSAVRERCASPARWWPDMRSIAGLSFSILGCAYFFLGGRLSFVRFEEEKGVIKWGIIVIVIVI